MQELLQLPAVQGGIAPLAMGLVIATTLAWSRLSGLAAAGGFLTAAYLAGSLSFWPLTAVKKIILFGLLAAGAGAYVDFSAKGARIASLNAGALSALASVWIFWGALAQRPTSEALALGVGVAAFVFWTVATTLPLRSETLRVGAIGLGLGVGAGIAAVLSASLLLGILAMGIAAGTGGFLLSAVVLGARVSAGATLALSVSVICSLLAGAAWVLAQLPVWCLPVLAFVPLAARLPLPERWPQWAAALLVSTYSLAVGTACALLAWKFSA